MCPQKQTDPTRLIQNKKRKLPPEIKKKRKHFSLMLAHILGQFAQKKKSKYTGAEALVHFAPL